jgi:hypothetical protein
MSEDGERFSDGGGLWQACRRAEPVLPARPAPRIGQAMPSRRCSRLRRSIGWIGPWAMRRSDASVCGRGIVHRSGRLLRKVKLDMVVSLICGTVLSHEMPVPSQGARALFHISAPHARGAESPGKSRKLPVKCDFPEVWQKWQG